MKLIVVSIEEMERLKCDPRFIPTGINKGMIDGVGYISFPPRIIKERDMPAPTIKPTIEPIKNVIGDLLNYIYMAVRVATKIILIAFGIMVAIIAIMYVF